MALIAKEKEQIVEKFKKSDNDTGSPEVQIGDKGRSTDPSGATGYGVRTLVEWCQAVAADAKEGLSQG